MGMAVQSQAPARPRKRLADFEKRRPYPFIVHAGEMCGKISRRVSLSEGKRKMADPSRPTRSGFVGAAAVLLATLAGCATAIPPVEVTRFHGPGPVAQSGGFTIEPMPGQEAGSVEFRSYAGAVSQAMQRFGFTDETALQTVAPSQYVTLIGFSRDVRSPMAARSPVSVGVGGATGSYGSGLGLGIGIDLSGKPKNVVTTQLSVQIRRRANNEAIWEGRAMTQAKEGTPAAQPGIASEKLASALFSGYPGKSGETITVK